MPRLGRAVVRFWSNNGAHLTFVNFKFENDRTSHTLLFDNMKDYTHPEYREITLPKVLQALSDPCRLTIVRALLHEKGGELACSEIPLKVAKATRSHHFDVLREAGVIEARPEGTKCMTRVREKTLNRKFPGLLKLVLAAR